MNDTTDFLLKIVSAIAKIDYGCPSCIELFLADVYMKTPFDISLIVNELNQPNNYRPISEDSILNAIHYREIIIENKM